MRDRRGCIGCTRWIQKETLRRDNWKFGRGLGWREGVLTRAEKVMVLDWGQSEVAVNSCVEYLEGRPEHAKET